MDPYPKSHLRTAIVTAVTLAVVVMLIPTDDTPARTKLVSLSIEVPASPLPQAAPAEPTATDPGEWVSHRVRKGESLSTIFGKRGLSAAQLQEVMSVGRDVAMLKRIRPGQTLELHVDDDRLQGLRFEVSALRTLIIARGDAGFTARFETTEPDTVTAFRTAQITVDAPSLYHAGKRNDLSDNVIMQLSYIFQWDISFAWDLREGDSFSLLYEEMFVDGNKVKEGNILAARFTNRGRTYTAVRYAGEDGDADYFAPDGRSMRKAFIRDPVHFSHVSSRFNLRRMHPIHKRVMPHRGIDYAANTGTPVVAAGDGTVKMARQNSASGKYIVVKHGERYTTKYLHLSRFAKGIRAGKSVRQGQTIGFVGATGWATAPHLHYEFLVSGTHRNPRTVKLPKAAPISVVDKTRFEASTSTWLARLQSLSGETGYASTDALESGSKAAF